MAYHWPGNSRISASGFAECVTLYCFEYGMWSNVAIKRIHENGSTGSPFSPDKLGGLHAAELNHAEILQRHDVVIKVYFSWL